MSTTNLQIPLSKDLKLSAQQAAANMGFSSLQELVRVFLGKVVQGTVDVVFAPKAVQLSPKAIKRYNKIIKEIDEGKNITRTNSLAELFKTLNEN